MNSSLQGMKNVRENVERKLKQSREQADKTAKDMTQAAIEKYQKELILQALWRSCLNCCFWQQGNNAELPTGCALHRAMPPAQVILHGCRDWEDDIPF